ncbi:MAG: 2-iminoacetate synthase ThiH [Bacteroidia bacterium]|nr:2-iminoacetate synthase ThiH [Bacteroidia bacterium]
MKHTSFSDILSKFDFDAYYQTLNDVSVHDIHTALNQKKFSLKNFIALISPGASKFLPLLLNESASVTRKRFGNVIQLFAPIYLSNECQNICTYCGFSFTNKIPRKTLTKAELAKEAEFLKKKGFEHVLLVTGEAQKSVGMEYFMNALDVFIPLFSSVAMEVQPLEETDYRLLHQRGVYSILVYQETYIRSTYAKVHPKGKKSNFEFRLECPERVCNAGMHHCGLGVLIGLDDWRLDSLLCAMHLDFLQKKYWQTRFSVSFPRIRPAEGVDIHPSVFSHKELAQLMAAYRICFPDLEITLSTRESPHIRDQILSYGVTHMSAESKTHPGGYTQGDALEQFHTDDHRTLEEIKESIRKKGLDPMMKNWFASEIY